MSPVHTKDGGHAVHCGISFPLHGGCSTCSGKCPAPTACHVPQPEPASSTFGVVAWVVLAAILVGLAVGAVRLAYLWS